MNRVILFFTILFSFGYINAQLPYSESFESGFGNWFQISSPSDNFDWTRMSGSTPSPGTGPDAASDGSYYLYIEATGHNNPPQSAIIEDSLDFSNTTLPIMSFDYHMYGKGIGVLQLYVKDFNVPDSKWIEIWNNFTDMGNQWNNEKICLGKYAGSPDVHFRFKATTGYSDSSDIAIDNIKIVDFYLQDSSHTNVTCGGYSDGSITITAGGGYGPYEFSIDDGVTYTSPQASKKYTFTGLSGADYPIRIRDGSGCELKAGVVTVQEPQKPDISYTKDDVSPCIYSKSGQIHISAKGDYTPFSYSISGFGGPFQSSGDFTNLDTGKYQIAVKNSKGCIALGDKVQIFCPTAIKIANITAKDVSTCYGDCNGSVTIYAGGGNQSLSFALDTGSSQVFVNNNVFTDLCAGTYRVIVEDNAGCKDTSSYVTVNQPTELKFTSISHTDVSGCYGDTSGTITLSASGGSGTISYSIDNANVFQTSGFFHSLAAGTYKVWARDTNNCSANGGDVVISQPAKLITDSVIYADVTGCYGNANGQIHIYAHGGTSPLNYSIDNGKNFSTSKDFLNLDVGTYTPVVKDKNGCSDTSKSVTIKQPTELVITNVNKYNVTTCYGDSTGKIQVFVNNGTPPYEYSVDGGSHFQTDYTISHLPAGTYNIVVRDANFCTKQLDSTITITQPTKITITKEISTNPKCYGGQGSIYVEAQGGTGRLFVSVDSGYSFPYDTSTVFYKPAGIYHIAVRDKNACKAFGSTLTISQPDSLAIDSVKTVDVQACYGDSTGIITIYASGGVSPIKYSIDNGKNFQLDSSFHNLPAGVGYLPFIKDANGCYVLGKQQTIGQPPQLVVSSIKHTNIDTCHGLPAGTITISANGGTGTIYYSIDSGKTYINNGGHFSSLYAGTYNIKVKDQHNCVANGWAETIIQPDTLLIDSIFTQNVRCNGQSNGLITIYASGGQPQVKYSIDAGTSYNPSRTFTNLGPGNYNIIVRDNYNCQVSSTATISQPSELILDTVIYHDVNTCYGEKTGYISVTAHGGTPDLQYAYAYITSKPNNFQNKNVFDSVYAGAYVVYVRDANNCQVQSSSFSIGQPKPVRIDSVKKKNISCYGLNDGSLQIFAGGGTPGYQYSIDNGQTWKKTNIFANLTPKEYYLTVQDTNHCKLKYPQSYIITQPSQLEFYDVHGYNPSCFGYKDGKIIVYPTGGTAPYTYTLNDTLVQKTTKFDSLWGGKYWVTLTDAHHCVAHSDTLTLVMPDNMALFTKDTSAGCSPLEVHFTPVSNKGIFAWDFGDNNTSPIQSPTHIFINKTDANVVYRIKAKAEHGVCVDTSSQTVTVYSQPNANFKLDNNTHYYPDTIVNITNLASSYSTYKWNFGDGTPEFDGVNPGSHAFPGCGEYDISVIVSNTHSCLDTAFQALQITSVAPKAGFTVDTKEGCAPLSVKFTNTSSTAVKYEWSFDGNIFSTDTNTSYTFEKAKNYLVVLKAYGFCGTKDTVSKMLYAYPEPHVDFTWAPDTVGVGQNVIFQNYTTGATSYIWSFGDTTMSGEDNPIHQYQKPGIYSVLLKATSANGCTDSLYAENAIFVSSDFYFKFPNAFTPDGDGKNDLFKPIFNLIDYCTVEIYSRRGNLVFRTKDYAHTFWDGTIHGHRLPTDVYVWRAFGRYKNGRYFEYVGDVTLIR
jgi:gliding motility-associated-like protein